MHYEKPAQNVFKRLELPCVIMKWCNRWLVTISNEKTVAMLFSRKRGLTRPGLLKLGGKVIKMVSSHKHLGLNFTSDLSYSKHINCQLTNCNKLLGLLKKVLSNAGLEMLSRLVT